MRILLFEWNAYMQRDLEAALTDLGIGFDRFSYNLRSRKDKDERFDILFAKQLVNNYDAVFSFNFYPQVSRQCYEHGIKYIAWEYDSPIKYDDIKTLMLPNNYIFMFDKVEASELTNRGIETVYHMPLAVYAKRLEVMPVTKEIEDAFACDCSFVGNFYGGNYEKFLAVFPEKEKGFSDGLLNAQLQLSGANITELIDVKEIIDRVNPYIKKASVGGDFCITEENYKFLFSYYSTKIERTMLVENLAKICHFRVFSSDGKHVPANVEYLGTADYIKELPYIFKYSKINLHQTMKRIRSGIPLRALDIMAAGGLLFANAQPELLENFVHMEDFVCYNSVDEAMELARYLLDNPDIREEIAKNGQRKCLENFSYEKQLGKIFEIVGIEI